MFWLSGAWLGGDRARLDGGSTGGSSSNSTNLPSSASSSSGGTSFRLMPVPLVSKRWMELTTYDVGRFVATRWGPNKLPSGLWNNKMSNARSKQMPRSISSISLRSSKLSAKPWAIATSLSLRHSTLLLDVCWRHGLIFMRPDRRHRRGPKPTSGTPRNHRSHIDLHSSDGYTHPSGVTRCVPSDHVNADGASSLGGGVSLSFKSDGRASNTARNGSSVGSLACR
ncbi:hypothetical protein H257_02878 [Aphanomyces astaci]|uniref:Uncharacterized protein n=1 Tax=Aphanomyces astaci TaxID=112090 RepID=W4GZ19_APHAT|nr:hypothetical protein H257_02878 [Aphanomyces astaci]ETV84985.1 hypothetical protein H257_02878 [Aphanomyces astaci]|eukprot:XP_009825003.1 hypothetical protein H257_02878 [Aphanomyces astaci]